MDKNLLGLAVLGTTLAFAVQAQAVPILQVYIEGSAYDSTKETWVLDLNSESTFNVWVLGNVNAVGRIDDVKLSAAVLTSETNGGRISLSSTTTSFLPDPSNPTSPGSPTLSAEGAVPTLGDGKPLPVHGIYGTGVSF